MAGTVRNALGPEPGSQGSQTELVKSQGRVDQHVAIRAEPGEEVDLVDEGRVDHNQAVRCHHGLTRPYLLPTDPAIGDHGGAHPLGAEARERLREPVVFERGKRQELGCGYGSLPTSTMEAHREHGSSVSCSSAEE